MKYYCLYCRKPRGILTSHKAYNKRYCDVCGGKLLTTGDTISYLQNKLNDHNEELNDIRSELLTLKRKVNYNGHYPVN